MHTQDKPAHEKFFNSKNETAVVHTSH